MNIKYVLAFVGGAAVGAGVSYYILRKKTNAEIDKAWDSVDEYKEMLKKANENDKKKQEIFSEESSNELYETHREDPESGVTLEVTADGVIYVMHGAEFEGFGTVTAAMDWADDILTKHKHDEAYAKIMRYEPLDYIMYAAEHFFGVAPDEYEDDVPEEPKRPTPVIDPGEVDDESEDDEGKDYYIPPYEEVYGLRNSKLEDGIFTEYITKEEFDENEDGYDKEYLNYYILDRKITYDGSDEPWTIQKMEDELGDLDWDTVEYEKIDDYHTKPMPKYIINYDTVTMYQIVYLDDIL